MALYAGAYTLVDAVATTRGTALGIARGSTREATG
jgi:hypothetical protein